MMTPKEIEFSDSPLFYIIFVGCYFSIWGLLYDQEHGQTTLRQHEVWVKPSNSARLRYVLFKACLVSKVDVSDYEKHSKAGKRPGGGLVIH